MSDIAARPGDADSASIGRTRLGGYQLIRRIGAGPLAEVHLAAPAVGAVTRTVAVKRWRAGIGAAIPLGEAEVLWRARGAHVVAVLDVVDIPEAAPALVLERVHVALTTVLASGGGLAAAQAATVLAPIAATLRAMHGAGVAHGRLGPGAVRVDDRGAPILVGFGGATRFAAGATRAALAGIPEVVADVIAFHRMALALLPARGDDGPLSAILGAPDAALEIAADPEAWLDRFEQSIFRALTPLPLPMPPASSSPSLDPAPASVDLDGRRGAHIGPAAVLRAVSAVSAVAAAPVGGDEAGGIAWPADGRRARRDTASLEGRHTVLPAWLDRVGGGVIGWVVARAPAGAVAAGTTVLRTVTDAMRARSVRAAGAERAAGASGTSWPARAAAGPPATGVDARRRPRASHPGASAPRGVRRRVWIPAAVIGAGLIAALVLVPGNASEPGAGDADAPAAARPAGVARAVGAPARGAADGAGGAAVEAAAPDGTDSAGDGHGTTDPEAVVLTLLQARADCLAARDADCIADVVQPGSPAESADLAAIAGERPPDGAAWRPVAAGLVDLLGGTALVDVVVETPAGTGSAPVLLIRTGAEWRIRAILGGPDAAGGEDAP